MRTPIGLGALAAIVVVGLITLFNGIYTINDGERGVITYQGKVVGVAEPGMNWKVPFLSDVHIFSVRDQVNAFDGLTAYTKDLQTATISRLSVNFRILPGDVETIYRRTGTTAALFDQQVTRRVNEVVEKVFGQYNAEKAVAERARLSQEVADQIKSTDPLLQIVSVQVENFSFPDEYEANINARMAAEVAALQAEQTAKKTVIEAQAQADSQLAIAKASADAVRLAGEAEAAAIQAKGDALRQNPELVSLIKAERWDGKLPTTVLPGDTVPFLDVATVQ